MITRNSTPIDPVAAHPGDSVEYIVGQREAGNPTAVLQGPLGTEDDQVKFEWKLVEGSTPSLFKASVQLGNKLKPQTIKIMITDSQGVASQTLPIVVTGPMRAAPAASAPESSEAKPTKKVTDKQA